MTTEQLAEIRARLDAATPRPWVYLGHDTAYEGQVFSVTDGPDGMNMVQVCQEPTGDERPADMELVAHAPTDLAALLAYVRELEGLLRDLCEDSRAAAEAVRLRKVVEVIRGREWFYTNSRDRFEVVALIDTALAPEAAR